MILSFNSRDLKAWSRYFLSERCATAFVVMPAPVVTLYEKLKTIIPGQEGWIGRLDTLMLKDYSRHLQEAETSLSKNKHNFLARQTKAYLYWLQGNYEHAQTEYKHLLKLISAFPVAEQPYMQYRVWIARALIHESLEQWREASDCYSKVFAINDETPIYEPKLLWSYIMGRALCYLQMGENKKAEADLDLLAKLQVNNRNLLLFLGQYRPLK